MKEAMLYRQLDDGKVHCRLCNHHCRIADSEFGVCGVRQNQGGRLYTHAYGQAIAAHVDPIEKKPLYHFLPGSWSYSIATAGCNFKCGFCQNWQISQMRSGDGISLRSGKAMTPEKIVKEAVAERCKSISYTYTEPTIFFEYAYDTAKIAKQEGLGNVFVTNGFMTTDAIDLIAPYLDACNVDLKSFSGDFYRETCKGRLQPVLESIRKLKATGIWVEITTLVIPGTNDSEAELKEIARFIADVDTHMPWHISRFHPDYQFSDTAATPMATMKTAYEAGKSAGLHYIYIGNVSRESNDTVCPKCGEILIRRRGFTADASVSKKGLCPQCAGEIAGVYDL